MKSWSRPLIVALWVTLITVIIFAVVGITVVPATSSGLMIAVASLFALTALVASFMLLHRIEPRLRTLRNDLVLNIILSLLLILFLLYLTFVLPLTGAILSLIQFGILLFLFVALIASVLFTALYFVVCNRRDFECD